MTIDDLPKFFTWELTSQDNTINSIEHPLTEWCMPKQEFFNTFKNVCVLLNGETMSDYVSFFFKRDVINSSHLKFTDNDAKMDFLDWAIEEKCLPSIKEFCASETKKEKLHRKKQQSKKAQTSEKLIKTIKTQFDRLEKLKKQNSKKVVGCKCAIDKLIKQMENMFPNDLHKLFK